MTLARRLAERISVAVVRWVSPGYKEWAEGLEREVAFIDSDWRALMWAIGSVRVLLDRPATVAPGSEHPHRAPSVLDWSKWISYLSVGLESCTKILASTGWPQRMGWCLVLLGVTYWTSRSVLDWLRERWQPSPSNFSAYTLFLREGLELKLARYRTVRRWFPAIASWSIALGYWLIFPDRVDIFWGLFNLVCLSLIWLDTPAKIQSRIELIDAQIAQGPPVNLTLNLKPLHSDHWGQPRTPDPGRWMF